MIPHESRELRSRLRFSVSLLFEWNIDVRFDEISCLLKSLFHLQRRLRIPELFYLIFIFLSGLYLLSEWIVLIKQLSVNHPSLSSHDVSIRFEDSALSEEALHELDTPYSLLPDRLLGIL